MDDISTVTEQILSKIKNDGMVVPFIPLLNAYNSKTPKCLLIAGSYLINTVLGTTRDNHMVFYVNSKYSSTVIKYLHHSMGDVSPTIDFHTGNDADTIEYKNQLVTYTFSKSGSNISVVVTVDGTIPKFSVDCENIYFDGTNVIISDIYSLIGMKTSIYQHNVEENIEKYTQLGFNVKVNPYFGEKSGRDVSAWMELFSNTSMIRSNWENVAVRAIFRYALTNTNHKVVHHSKMNIDDLVECIRTGKNYSTGWSKNIVLMDHIEVPEIRTDLVYSVACSDFSLDSIGEIISNRAYFTNLYLDMVMNYIFKADFGMALILIHTFNSYISEQFIDLVKNVYCHSFCIHYKVGCNISVDKMFDIIVEQIGGSVNSKPKMYNRWEFSYSESCNISPPRQKVSNFKNRFLSS